MEKLIIPDAVDIPALRGLRQILDQRIVGQERARDEVIDAFSIALAGLNQPNHPITSLLFLGPTGVGKTELVKAISDYFYEKFADPIKEYEKSVNQELEYSGARERRQVSQFRLPRLMRVDCGRFAGSMAHGVIELLGSPPSYVGGEQPPILSQRNFPPRIIRVLLFDELEKAYIDSRDGGAELTGLLMSILDEARIQNNRGEDVSFVWTIIAFTSNYGTKEIMAELMKTPMGFSVDRRNNRKKFRLTAAQVEELNENIYQTLTNFLRDPIKSPFRPELLNRIDRTIVFRFLTPAEYGRILDKELAAIQSQMDKGRGGILLRFTPEAKQWLLVHGVDFEFGVRSLQRFLRRKVRDPLSKLQISKKIRPGDIVEVRPPEDSDADELAYWKDANPAKPLLPPADGA